MTPWEIEQGPHRRPTGYAVIGLAAALSLYAVVLLSAGSKELGLVSLGVIGLATSCAGIAYSARHREWLIVWLILSDQLLSCQLIPEEAQRVGHYLLICLICLPILPYAVRYRTRILSGGFGLYAIMYGWALVTVLYSIDPAVSIGRVLIGALGFCAISLVAFEVEGPEDVIRLFERVAVACGVVLGVLVISALVLPHDITWNFPTDLDSDALGKAQSAILNTGDRFRGIFDAPNSVGALMMITVGAAFVCWPRSRGWKRLALALAIGSSVLLTALADSRTPCVAVAMGGALYLIWRYRGRGVLICAIPLLLLLLLRGWDLGLSRAPSGDNDRDVATLTGRTEVWQFAIQEIAERPLTGYGYGVEGQIFQSREFPLWWGPWDLNRRIGVHNGYIGRAVSMGIPALLLWLFVVLRPWVAAFRRDGDPWNLKPIALLVIVPILVHSMAESALGDFHGLVGVVFGMAWAIGERQRLLAVERALETTAESRAQLPPAIAAILGCLVLSAGMLLTPRIAAAPFLSIGGIETESRRGAEFSESNLIETQKLIGATGESR